MNPILRNILAVVAGLVVVGIVNMSIVQLSGYIIPPPEGAETTTIEGLKASMHLLQPKHFLMPFLAHALGTFAGALLTAIIAANRKMILALIVGVFFLAGGISAVVMLPAPMWFNVVDLVGAYIPMSILAAYLVVRRKGMKIKSE